MSSEKQNITQEIHPITKETMRLGVPFSTTLAISPFYTMGQNYQFAMDNKQPFNVPKSLEGYSGITSKLEIRAAARLAFVEDAKKAAVEAFPDHNPKLVKSMAAFATMFGADLALTVLDNFIVRNNSYNALVEKEVTSVLKELGIKEVPKSNSPAYSSYRDLLEPRVKAIGEPPKFMDLLNGKVNPYRGISGVAVKQAPLVATLLGAKALFGSGKDADLTDKMLYDVGIPAAFATLANAACTPLATIPTLMQHYNKPLSFKEAVGALLERVEKEGAKALWRSAPGRVGLTAASMVGTAAALAMNESEELETFVDKAVRSWVEKDRDNGEPPAPTMTVKPHEKTPVSVDKDMAVKGFTALINPVYAAYARANAAEVSSVSNPALQSEISQASMSGAKALIDQARVGRESVSHVASRVNPVYQNPEDFISVKQASNIASYVNPIYGTIDISSHTKKQEQPGILERAEEWAERLIESRKGNSQMVAAV